MKRSLALAAAFMLLVPALAYAHAPGLDKPLPALHEYLGLGFEHILSGFDHLAFLLGLAAGTRSLRALLSSVTAFTLAHSLSLALGVLGFVAPPSRWVEVAIALSIAYVALDNVFGREQRRRHYLSFAFGFVHGFGFAGALQEIGVPLDRAPAALALFNLGVEAGQLAVLSLMLPLLRALSQRPARRLLDIALVALGLAWAAERTLEDPTQTAVTLARASDDTQASSAQWRAFMASMPKTTGDVTERRQRQRGGVVRLDPTPAERGSLSSR